MRRTLRFALFTAAVLLLGLRILKPRGRSEGFYVMLPAHDAPQLNCPNRTVVLQVLGKHSLKINFEAISDTGLRRRLGEIYNIQDEHVLFLTAEPDVSFQEVARVVDRADGAVANLHIALLTPKSNNEPCLSINLQGHQQKIAGPRQ